MYIVIQLLVKFVVIERGCQISLIGVIRSFYCCKIRSFFATIST